jgi:hypothetical protein
MRKLVTKFLILSVAVLVSQIVLANLWEDRRLPMRDQLLAEIKGRTDLLIFGDSVMQFTSKSDSDSRTLGEMIRGELPNHQLAIVQDAGYAAEIYSDILDYVLRRGVRPRAVILTVNLRTFGLMWDQRPDFQFSSELLRLRWGDTLGLAADRPMAAYQVYSRIEGYPTSVKEYMNLTSYRGAKRMGTIREILEGQGKWATVPWLDRTFSLTYMYPLEPVHRKIQTLQKLARTCRSAGIPLLAYVTPVDVQSGEFAVGPEFRSQVACNIQVIRKALADCGAPLLDLSFALDSDVFEWRSYPNEHLRDLGRSRLAAELCARIRAGGF